MAAPVESNSHRWMMVTLLAWAVVAALLTMQRWDAIAALDLPDTDDAQRLVQVRDWLDGQAWGDVDQYRMNPPHGANMHWSRLPDLPLAAVIESAAPVIGRAAAERAAATAVPLLTLLFAALMTGLAARRLAGTQAAIFAPLFLVSSNQVLGMFAPLRIDHHGWQMALLIAALALLLDPRKRFGSGVAAGGAVAAALMIGLEMLPHAVMASLVLVGAWCRDGDRGRLLSGYGGGLALAAAAMYPPFVPTARWGLAACDAMSPVYLAGLLPAGVLAALLPHLGGLHTAARRWMAAVAGFGAAVAAVLLIFPACAGGPMAGLDPSILPVLAQINEARPISRVFISEPAMAVVYGVYPMVGIVCATYLMRVAEEDRRFGWMLLLSVLSVATVLMFMQIRAANIANMLAAIAAGAAAAFWLPAARAIPRTLPRVLATAAILGMLSNAFPLFAGLAARAATGEKAKPADTIETPGCSAAVSLMALRAYPNGTILNVVDMGPALLLHTGHTVIAGPYHRTPAMITDMIRVWFADEAEARHIAAHYGADYVLTCGTAPNIAAALAQAPDGFASQLEAGHVPTWLERLPLPADSPLRFYRIKG